MRLLVTVCDRADYYGGGALSYSLAPSQLTSVYTLLILVPSPHSTTLTADKLETDKRTVNSCFVTQETSGFLRKNHDFAQNMGVSSHLFNLSEHNDFVTFFRPHPEEILIVC